MRVFYSHPMKIYGTEVERREMALIERRFVGCEVVDPSALQAGLEPGRETEFYLRVLDSCDCLVFSRYFGYITEGVKPEIEHALAKGKPTYELRGGRFIEVTGPVGNLPAAQRLKLRTKGALSMRRREPRRSA
jgi:hypothetical protein